ncbi:Hsp20/alpha crystallin family protein [Alkalilimnicola sp. S0819]|uniref:Hsp20/alpha crystallin family protein n=1 Tax=Alkalilimnicola sp. S0819 TaxID=2613922 RepID=UPI001261E1A9|nr:Hsp20/alpha crystallin family protein [Alkalilimnicola sp. S0819]KAB7627587.1 Hsp20/alpha crystallin family protein [Alkalilimnicola sp. S0819]MPQ15748.1 Hsp20 family protein [Alkalilimnicola sp. S0819]
MAKEREEQSEGGIMRTTPQRWGRPFEEIERLFNDLRPWRSGLWGEAEIHGNMPRVDLMDRESEMVLRAELPGVKKEDLDITVDEQSVSLHATRHHEERTEKGNYYRAEISRGEYLRTIPLPCLVDGDKAKASFKDGMLELTLPKVEQSRRKRITVQ